MIAVIAKKVISFFELVFLRRCSWLLKFSCNFFHYCSIEIRNEAISVLIRKIRKDLGLNLQKQDQFQLE